MNGESALKTIFETGVGRQCGNTADSFRAGVDVVGVGGELVNQKLLDARDFGEITTRARVFRAEVVKGRG